MIQLARIEAEIASRPFWSEASIAGLTALRWDACGTWIELPVRCTRRWKNIFVCAAVVHRSKRCGSSAIGFGEMRREHKSGRS